MVMGTVRDIQLSSSKQSVFRDQLVTVADLDAFKTDLLTGIRGLLSDLKERQSKKWLKSYEVKKLLAISNGTLQTLRSNGTLPFTKIGGTIYYNSEDIDKMLLEKQKHLVPGYLPKRKY